MTKIIHVLDHSLPQQSGYASRSHAILMTLTRFGLDVEAMTGPKHGVPDLRTETIDSVTYHRTPLDRDASTDGIGGQIRTIVETGRRLRSIAEDIDPLLVHAHSPCLNGLACLNTGSIPMIYEMRSSWEDAAVSMGVTTTGSIRYRISRVLEDFVVRRASAVVVICNGLRDELLHRGIPAEKIAVIPNAVPDSLLDAPGDSAVRSVVRKYELEGHRTIGYFGSFFEWEGVDVLLRAMPTILAQVPDCRLVLAGGGRQEELLLNLVVEHGLEEAVIFAGRVPADEITAFYGAVNVMAFPRRSNRLTEMVTPLKPLEAMAQRTPVVASNVGGHRELIRDGKTGYLHRADNSTALADTLVRVLTQSEAVRDVVARARDFVCSERKWSVVCRSYIPLYEKLAGVRLIENSVVDQV